MATTAFPIWPLAAFYMGPAGGRSGDLFLLEGALLLRVRGLSSVRPTRDLDLPGQASAPLAMNSNRALIDGLNHGSSR
jgi:hypothetical protein